MGEVVIVTSMARCWAGVRGGAARLDGLRWMYTSAGWWLGSWGMRFLGSFLTPCLEWVRPAGAARVLHTT